MEIAEKCLGEILVSRERTDRSALMEWTLSSIWGGYCTEWTRTGRRFYGTFGGQDKFGGS